MMQNYTGHGGRLHLENAKLFGGLLHNPGQRSVVSVAHERAQMMCDVMVEPAREPTYDQVARRILGRFREDGIHAVVDFAAPRGKVPARDRVRGLDYQPYRLTTAQT